QAFAGLIVPSLFSKRLCSRLNLLQTRCRTPARNDSYADDIGAPIMQPAPCGATHDKLTQRPPFCDGIRAFATRAPLCLSPPSHGSKCSCRLDIRLSQHGILPGASILTRIRTEAPGCCFDAFSSREPVATHGSSPRACFARKRFNLSVRARRSASARNGGGSSG